MRELDGILHSEVEVLETVTNTMVQPKDSDTMQQHRDDKT